MKVKKLVIWETLGLADPPLLIAKDCLEFRIGLFEAYDWKGRLLDKNIPTAFVVDVCTGKILVEVELDRKGLDKILSQLQFVINKLEVEEEEEGEVDRDEKK